MWLDSPRLRAMVFGLALVLLFLLVAGCSSTPTPTVAPVPTTVLTTVLPSPSAPARESPQPAASPAPTVVPRHVGGSVVIGEVGQPGRQIGTLPAFIRDALYDSLLTVDARTGALGPGLAERYQVSDDARTFTFYLRPGVQWHDGKPLTADDVVWTIKTLSSSATRLVPTADFGPLADAQATDPQTVVVTFSQAYCPALTYVGTLKILPAHLLKDKDLSALSDEQLVGSGSLILKSWTNDQASLDRNPDYWNGTTAIEHWTLRFYPTDGAARAAAAAGRVDLLVDDTPGSSVNISPGFKTLTVPANRFYGLALNRDGGLLADAGLRQAVTLALDEKTLAQAVAGDSVTTLSASVLPTFWAAPAGLSVLTGDSAHARQMLDAAGWRDSNGDGIVDKGGKPLRLTMWTIADDPIEEPLAQTARALLAQVGIQALVQLEDHDGLLTRVLLHEYDLAILPWNIPLDPDQHWYWQSSENKKGQGLNVSSYASPAVDDLLTRGERAAGCETRTRQSIYAELFKTLGQDRSQVFLFAPPVTVAARDSLKGLAPSSFAGVYWNLNQWEIVP